MKALFIFTGGTIGSSIKKDKIYPDSQNIKRLLSLYQGEIAMDIENPYTILSETLNGSYLNKLLLCVAENLDKKLYDAILIAHGTDTLQYSAAALSYCFCKAPVPIVLVSSNYVLTDSRANGKDNFLTALDFIEHGKKCGVFVSYNGILPGNRLLPHMPYSDEVYPLMSQTATAGGARQTAASSYIEADKSASQKALALDIFDAAGLEQYESYTAKIKALRLFPESPVLLLNPYPGCIYPRLTGDIKSVILTTYHSGTLDVYNSSLKDMCEQAALLNIPVFLSGLEGDISYATTSHYRELGIIPLPKASYIAMYMKAWLISAINNDYSIMNKKVADDII